MKKILLIVVFMLLKQLNAQQLHIKKSPLYEDNKKRSELAMMVSDKQGGVFAIRPYFAGMMKTKSSKLGYYIEHYNRELKLLKSYTYKLAKNKDIAAAFVNDTQFYFVEYEKDKKAKKINVIANYTALDEMKFKQKTLFSVPSKNINSFYYDLMHQSKKDAKLLANVAFSENKNYALFYFDMFSRKEDTQRVYVLNNKMELVWSKEIKFQYKDRNFQVSDFQVSNDGTAYILGKIHQGGVFNRSYYYQLYKFNKAGLQGKTPVQSDNYYVSSLKIIKSKSSDAIHIVGFYSQYYARGSYVDSFDSSVSYSGGSYRVRGVCTYKIDASNMTVKSNRFQKFSSQFIQDKYGKVRKNSNGRLRNASVDNIVLRDVFFADNGDMIVTAEEMTTVTTQPAPVAFSSSYSTSYGNYNSGATSYSYVYGDAMILRLDATGKLLWSRNINKNFNTSSPYDPLSSFSVTASADKVFLFLTANKKLGKLSKGRKTFREGFSGVTKYNSKLYAIQFGKMGDWTLKTIVDNKTSDVIFYSKLGFRMPDNTIYFFGRFRHDKQLMRIDF